MTTRASSASIAVSDHGIRLAPALIFGPGPRRG